MGLLDDAIREHLELKRKHGAPEDEIERAEHEALTPARREPAGAVAAGSDDPEAGAGDAIGEASSTGVVPPPPPPPPPPPADEDPVDADEHAAGPAPADPDAPEPALPPIGEGEEAVPATYAQETQVRSTIDPADVPPAPRAEREPGDAPDGPGGPGAPGIREAEEAPAPASPKLHGDPAIDQDDLDPDEVPSDEQLGGPAGARPDLYRSRTVVLDEPLDESTPPPPAGGPPPPPPPPAGEDVLEETPDFLQETPEHDKLWFEQKPPRDFDFD